MEAIDDVDDSDQAPAPTSPEAAPIDSASVAVKLTEADSLAAQAADSRKAALECLAEAQKLLADAKSAAAAISAAAEKMVSDQAVIATKSAHIQDAQTHADKVRAELDRVLTAASGDAAKAEALRTRSQTASDDIAKVSGDVVASKNSVDAALAAVLEAQGSAEESSSASSGLAEKAAQIESDLKKYEQRLQELANNLRGSWPPLRGCSRALQAQAWLRPSIKGLALLKHLRSVGSGYLSAHFFL
jgi:chromosome segregation ATPase